MQIKLDYYSAVPGVKNRFWVEEMVPALSGLLGSKSSALEVATAGSLFLPTQQLVN